MDGPPAGPLTMPRHAPDSADEDTLRLLLDAARRVGVDVRVTDLSDDEITAQSGFCLVRRGPTLIVDERLPAAAQIKILARELGRMNLEGIFLPPAVRAIIEGEHG